VGKRAWNSGFTGGVGKRAWNSGFAGSVGKRDSDEGEDIENNLINDAKVKRNWNSVGVRGSWGKRSRYLLIHPSWVSALKNSEVEKKSKGWMAMRGSWGRKKRSVIGAPKVPPIHESFLSAEDYWGPGAAKEIGFGLYKAPPSDRFTKKSIPKIDDIDINKLVAYFNTHRRPIFFNQF